MEKKDRIKPAAGSGATKEDIEGRVASAHKAAPARLRCTTNCGPLKHCPNNSRPCPGLIDCNVNVIPCSLARRS